MRIRRCASRLLGSASASSPALPGFEPPPPPTAHDSHAGFVAATSLEPCELSRSPWDLMAQLHPSDPQEEALFLETYFVAVAWRTSWLFQLQPSMPFAGSIKEEEEEEHKDEDMVDGVIFELRVAGRKKNDINKKVKEESIAGEVPIRSCKKNDDKKLFCRRPVSQLEPDTLCPYHTDQKPLAGVITKPRKRAAADEGFYYYAGFGPSRSKRHRVSSSGDTLPEPPPAGPKEEAPPEEEKHIEFVTAGQAQADCSAEHQPAAASACVDDELRCDDIAGIAGGDEESTDDDDVVQPRDIKTKSPLKKRWRKPVKARSLKSLMM